MNPSKVEQSSNKLEILEHEFEQKEKSPNFNGCKGMENIVVIVFNDE